LSRFGSGADRQDRASDAILVATGGSASERWFGANRCATARAGAYYGVIALTGSTALPDATRGMLEANAEQAMTCDVFGGPSAVSAAVRTAIKNALGW
jgi:hypothetical protein